MNALFRILRTFAALCIIIMLAQYSNHSNVYATTTQDASLLLQTDTRYFPETGYQVEGQVLSYWENHGGLMRFGYPLSSELQERSNTNGQIYTVQYFERAELEIHPDNQSPNNTQIALLGRFQYDTKYAGDAPNQTPNTDPGAILFPETGKHLGGTFLSYWQNTGGLLSYGYPISDEFAEISAANNKTYTVQYFERAIFELHPENSKPYDVLLSHLGSARYRAIYVLQMPPDVAVPVPSTMSLQAASYLLEALNYIQANSILRDKVDWVALRKSAINMARTGQTTSDTYTAIDMVLHTFNDGHCHLFRPGEIADPLPQSQRLGIQVWYQDRTVTAIEEGGLAQSAGVSVGDKVEEINNIPVQDLSASAFFAQLYGGSNVELLLLHENKLLIVNIKHDYFDPAWIPSGRMLDDDIGYINVPSNAPFGMYYDLDTLPSKSTFASIGQQIIRDIDTTNPAPLSGWVVDLQADSGGSVSPMVLSVAPLLGDGYLGGYVDKEGAITQWLLQDGKYYWVSNNAQEPNDQLIRWVNNPYVLGQSSPPVALLTGRGTASAGEATLISFRGRAKARTFGQPTSGLPNQPDARLMSDGAVLKLTIGLEMDRTGHIYGYNERIQPDQFSQPNYTLLPGSNQDPAVLAATEWLRTQTRNLEQSSDLLVEIKR